MDNGALILIYQSYGRYFGKLIDAGNVEDNDKLKEQGEIVIFKNFERRSQTEFCCGTIFAPKKKKTLSGTMILQNPTTLEIQGRLGVLTGTQTMTRVID